GLKGRWEILQLSPKVICDTAHNKEGLTYVMKQLLSESFENLHIVFGVVNDKDLSQIFDILPKEAIYYFCKPNIPRGLDAENLKSMFHQKGFKGNSYNSVVEAYKDALNKASNTDLVFIGGSTFVVAEIL
ncbi:MAG TPA: cyanophycin synthetase, partial [Flavobacteriaceae bacterium]|nr:cyanophycin synthetase [Flavobacteriaceae bacterium]